MVAWFYRVRRNAVIDHCRRADVSRRAVAAFAHEVVAEVAPSDARDAICGCVRTLTGTLKPEYTEAHERVDVEGMAVKDFAQAKSITASNAGVRLSRARAALRKQVVASCGTCAEHGCLECHCGVPPQAVSQGIPAGHEACTLSSMTGKLPRIRAPHRTGSMSRRTFVGGAIAGGAALALLRRGALAADSSPEPPTLRGTSFALTIDQVPVDFTGSGAVATAVNGSVPGPILRFREGDTVTLAVTNRLRETSSIHWHGLRVPARMDGVPGLSFAGIAPDETFVYSYPVIQRGTYWYHSHSRFQEQTGLYGPLIIDPLGEDPVKYDREHVILLSDWTDEDPGTVVGNLKQQSDYYNFHQRTAGDFVRDVQQRGLAGTLAERWMWNKMNMSPTDILDVSGATYTYLLNGNAPDANWTGLFRAGERVRLRFINGSAMSIFDVRIPGLAMTVVQSDGNDVEPVVVDEFRISVAETYDVIVEPHDDRAYTIFAQVEDRTGYARGTLAPRHGMAGTVPPMDPRPLRTMVDMGMAMGAMHGPPAAGSPAGAAEPALDTHGGAAPEHGAPMREQALPRTKPADLALGPTVNSIAEHPTERLDTAGEALVARRVLAYADLRALHRGTDPRPPSREIEIHLTGNMERFIWTFDGEKFSDAGPIRLRLGERVRIILVNDSMMEHPIHLHGLWSELENDHGEQRPYKHTINVKPGERLTYLVTADTPGHWAYHCHLLYHMEAGMFRTVIVS